MTFPDIVGDDQDARAGPARTTVRQRAARRGDLVSRRRAGPSAFLARRRGRPCLSARRASARDSGDGDRPRLQSDRSGRRRRRASSFGSAADAFGAIEIEAGWRVIAGAAAPDHFVAKAAAAAGVDGLAFLRGVPGSIGGALADERRRARRRDQGRGHRGARRRPLGRHKGFFERGDGLFLSAQFSARTTSFSRGATLQGRPGDPAAIEAEMERITRAREAVAADSGTHRRLDLQESPRRESLAAHR